MGVYVSAAVAAFAACVGVMGLLQRSILTSGLRQAEPATRRRALARWVGAVVGFQLLLGLVNFAGQIPLLLLAPIAGVLVDRWNRHRVLVVTQILSALQSAALAWLARLPFTTGATPDPTATAAPGPLPEEDSFAPFVS